MAGGNRSFVYDILRGRSSRPSIDRLADVARVLKVAREWLIHGIGEIEGTSSFTEGPKLIAGHPNKMYCNNGEQFEVTACPS